MEKANFQLFRSKSRCCQKQRKFGFFKQKSPFPHLETGHKDDVSEI